MCVPCRDLGRSVPNRSRTREVVGGLPPPQRPQQRQRQEQHVSPTASCVLHAGLMFRAGICNAFRRMRTAGALGGCVSICRRQRLARNRCVFRHDIKDHLPIGYAVFAPPGSVLNRRRRSGHAPHPLFVPWCTGVGFRSCGGTQRRLVF